MCSNVGYLLFVLRQDKVVVFMRRTRQKLAYKNTRTIYTAFCLFFDKRRTRQKKQVLLPKKQIEKVKKEEVGKAFVTKKWVHYGFYYFLFCSGKYDVFAHFGFIEVYG